MVKGDYMHSKFIRLTYVLILAAILLIAGGCAHEMPQKPDESIKQSDASEEKGDIAIAVEELKIALTIDPNNSVAKEKLNKLIIKQAKLAEEHYKAGLALKQTNLQGAKKEFLAALRIRTDYQEAMKELKNLQLESSEATLQVRAKREASVARTQEKVKITYEETVEETATDRAIALFEDGDYAAAINEFQKARSHSPNDPEIQRYLNLCWYNIGVSHYKKGEYSKALNAFTKVKKGFEDTDNYEKKCRSEQKKQVETLYKLGLKFFREQKLKEAIARWNEVLVLEPGHLKAKEYIEKANKLESALKKQH